MDNEERMIMWCRMWTEDPTLAHRLLTDDATQWSSVTPALDGVIGPRPAVDFMVAYRAQHINVFRPRVLVDGGDRFAYTWDVTHPDGVIHSGMDVNVLRDGLIAQNWTFVVGEQYTNWDSANPTRPADHDVLVQLVAGAHHSPIVDTSLGRVAAMKTVGGVGTVELRVLRDGVTAHRWSFTGTRPFSY